MQKRKAFQTELIEMIAKRCYENNQNKSRMTEVNKNPVRLIDISKENIGGKIWRPERACARNDLER